MPTTFTVLVMIVCATTSPDVCREERLSFSYMPVRACVMKAQIPMAQWAGDHPNWTIAKYHCELSTDSKYPV